ncbi:ABC transporter substrate-binding protein [Pseudonocardia sp.]|uniref:ABC transporter substrate-binding protein n=1 Tax=Pseudonocardia sp. TaxID=60912 RepID=UPI003D1062AC
MATRTRLQISAVITAVVLAATACGSGGGDGDGDDTLVALVPSLSGSGQDIITTLTTDFKPYWDEVFDYVLTQDKDGELAPGLASSWSVSDDHLTWSFVIRDDVIFHNGDRLTAEDVAWTWNRVIFDPQTRAPNSPMAPMIEFIRAEGDTVLLKTTRPDSTVPWWFNSQDGSVQGGIFPKAYFESVGAAKFFEQPIGTGPYKVVRINGEQSAELTAFTDPARGEWQKSRTAKIPNLEVRAVPDASSRLSLVQTGAADLAPIPLAMQAQAKGAALDVIPAENATFSNMYCLGFTTNLQSPCNDVKVREALSIAVDRTAIAASVYDGSARPSNGFFAGPGTFGYPEEIPAPPYDPERARALLAEAGFTEANPLTVQISIYSNDSDFPNMPTMAEAIAGNYQAIGVRAELMPGDWAANKGQLLAGGFPGMKPGDPGVPIVLFMRGMDNRYYFPPDQINSYTAAGGWEKFWNNDNLPEQVRLLDAVAGEFDATAQEARFDDYNRWMAQNFNQIPLLAADAIFVASDKVGDWSAQTEGKAYVNNLWSVAPASSPSP